MIERQRAIPRVAAASLTLGGTVISGCGDDGPSLIAQWCEQRTACAGGDAAEVRSCIEYYQEYLSYYGVMCAGAIGRALRCYLEEVSCDEQSLGDYTDCSAERVEIDVACVPPPPPPAPPGALRDFCELLVTCDYTGYYESVDECHQYYSRLIDDYLGYYGPGCGEAMETLLACYADLSCEEFVGFDSYSCVAEYDAFYETCY